MIKKAVGKLGKMIGLPINYFYRHKGYSGYYMNFYRKEMKKNYKQSCLARKDKRWAYKRGFNPWRIKQYNLTEENYKDIISDREYFYLHPINNGYSVWIDNKLTMKYILSPFDKYLPRYYYHLLKGRDVMRLMDCPKEYGFDIENVIDLLDEKKALAAKMAAGTYGIGFYKLEASEKSDVYIANGKEYQRKEFAEFLKSLNDYIITEFVSMHSQLKKIYPNAVNTIRVTVINETGNNPIIPFAFMRIGTKKSGAVDNVAMGGMVCKINVDTGEFYDGERLQDHVYVPARVHPDTGERIEGIIPNWDIVKCEIVKMAQYYPQLEWLGYDIAITEDGFKIIEINSHQGLHKAHENPEPLKAYLKRKVAQKKEKYNIGRLKK